jgi:hypothetical protein
MMERVDMATLTVGIGSRFQYHTIASAVAATHDGDVVQVQAGTYTNDFVTVRDSIRLQAVGGMVRMVATSSPPDGKAIITEGAAGKSVTISGFDLSGAKVAARNGAGIRYEGGNLTLVNAYIHDNQNGILGGAYANGTISMDRCEFAFNGYGDGYSHNIYIGDIANLTITNSYLHDAKVGHEVKSRAETTVITGSRIDDGPTGTASYSIDLPNGGNATITNDVIRQGPRSQNPAIIAYGEEGSLHAGTNVTIAGNSFLNDLGSSSASGVWNLTTSALTVSNNKVYGLSATRFVSGNAIVSGTTFLTREPALDTSHLWASTEKLLATFVPPIADLVPPVTPTTALPPGAPNLAAGSTSVPAVAAAELPLGAIWSGSGGEGAI